MAGEAILNFGPYGVPFVFLAWTWIVARGRKWILTMNPNDVRRLLSPLVSLICFLILNSDSDNIFFATFKCGTVPAVLLYICSTLCQSANSHHGRLVQFLRAPFPNQ